MAQTKFPVQFQENDSVSGHTNKSDSAIEVHHLLTDQIVRFKAFITTFSDDHQSVWNEQAVYGRMDPIMTFERTSRAIQVDFDVPSFDAAEAIKNFHKLTLLKQFLYPLYEKNSNFSNALAISSSPLVRVRFMNYIVNAQDPTRGLLGGLKGIQFAPDYEVGTYLGEDGKIVPKLFKVTLSFTVLHEHTTGWVKDTGEYYSFGNNQTEINYPYTDVEKSNAGTVISPTIDKNIEAANMNALLAANQDII